MKLEDLAKNNIKFFFQNTSQAKSSLFKFETELTESVKISEVSLKLSHQH